MRIKLLEPHRRNGHLHKPGAILDLNEDSAQFLIRRDRAVSLDAPALPVAIPDPPPRRRRRPTQTNPTPQE